MGEKEDNQAIGFLLEVVQMLYPIWWQSLLSQPHVHTSSKDWNCNLWVPLKENWVVRGLSIWDTSHWNPLLPSPSSEFQWQAYLWAKALLQEPWNPVLRKSSSQKVHTQSIWNIVSIFSMILGLLPLEGYCNLSNIYPFYKLPGYFWPSSKLRSIF